MYSLSAFKAYDIRGIYSKEIDLELAYLVANAIKIKFNIKSVVIGMDARDSSQNLVLKLSSTFSEIGVEVVNIGLCTTPMLNYAVATNVAEFGIMVSASHNPKQYNAFKLISSGPIQVGLENGLTDIKNLVAQKKLAKLVTPNKKVLGFNILPLYIDSIISKVTINTNKNLKITVDFGNGVGAISAIPLIKQNSNIVLNSLYKNPNGKFPNHDANPHDIKNFTDLQNSVIKSNSDFGVFFDGDADRCYFVDEKGNIVMQDLLVCLVAEHELKNKTYTNRTIYYDLRFTEEIKNVILKNGGVPKMLPVGNPIYKIYLKEKGGIFGAEFSGHVMFSQNYNIDDGLFLLLKVLQIFSNSDKKFSELIKKYKTYFASEEISISYKGKINFLLLSKQIKNNFLNYKSVKIDGLYLKNNSSWLSLRKSNTENILRFRCEADTYENFINIKQKVLTIINTFFLVKYF